MRKIIFCFAIFVSMLHHPKPIQAQSRLGIYIGAGATWYYGDMNDRLFTNNKLFRTYFNGGLLYRLHPKLDVLANVTVGKIVGADSLAIQLFNRKRNLNFESKIVEASLLLNYRLFRNIKSSKRVLNPYLIAGIGYLKFNPQTIYNGNKIDLQPLGTEGQFINGGNYPKPYKLYTLSFPLGIGIEIPLSNAFSVRLEYANHFTLTDYLDDVSTKYADSTKLVATPNGPISVAVSSNLTAGYPKEGYGRGNPKQRDSFSTFGISILYTPVNFHGKGSSGNSGGSRNKGVIGKKKKHKKSCPAFG